MTTEDTKKPGAQELNLSAEQIQGLAAALAAHLPAASGAESAPVPTVREFLPTVIAAVEDADKSVDRDGGTMRTYLSHFRLLVEGYPYVPASLCDDGYVVTEDEKLYPGIGDMRLDKVQVSDLRLAEDWAERRGRLCQHDRNYRRSLRGKSIRDYAGEGAHRTFLNATRCFFRVAVEERLISENPALALRAPGAAPSTRHSFTQPELNELWQAACVAPDADLAVMVMKTVLVSSARRQGLMALQVRDLDRERVSLWLREKGKKTEQPVTAELVEELLTFAASRGSHRPTDPVFCKRPANNVPPATPITARVIDTINGALQVPTWAEKRGVTIHEVRHHAVTQIERIAGPAVASHFARHSTEGRGMVWRYSKSSFGEVAAAVSIMTGTQHPLAQPW